jgi:hypothetical protein
MTSASSVLVGWQVLKHADFVNVADEGWLVPYVGRALRKGGKSLCIYAVVATGAGASADVLEI